MDNIKLSRREWVDVARALILIPATIVVIAILLRFLV
jgi:hypothetical protein